jgi:hypothetical protein
MFSVKEVWSRRRHARRLGVARTQSRQSQPVLSGFGRGTTAADWAAFDAEPEPVTETERRARDERFLDLLRNQQMPKGWKP